MELLTPAPFASARVRSSCGLGNFARKKIGSAANERFARKRQVVFVWQLILGKTLHWARRGDIRRRSPSISGPAETIPIGTSA